MPQPPYLAATLAAPHGIETGRPGSRLRVATYNVHRWAGVRGGRAFKPDRALDVLAELDADVIALQEVLRPTDGDADPLLDAARRLDYHLAFVVTRIHKRGELGNAILSRWPLSGALAIDLTFGRLEQRAALAVEIRSDAGPITIAATHLALVDRTRERQVRALLDHPMMATGPSVLMGDMNAWRKTAASRELDQAFRAKHHNASWPASYPSVRPVMALDRLYARGARLSGLMAHATPAARRGSDHLPVLATVSIDVG